MRMARATDGESFAILTNNPRLNTEVQLDLRLVEADQVTTPDLDRLSTIAVDGIVFDSAGNPVEYQVLRTHPGDGFYSARSDYDRIPADTVLHWICADRVSVGRRAFYGNATSNFPSAMMIAGE
jgi:capsid protein